MKISPPATKLRGYLADEPQIPKISIHIMTQVTDTDLKDIKTAIDNLTNSFMGLREETRVGFARLEGKIDNIDTRLSILESTATKLPDLAEKVEELKNWKQIAIVIFTGSVSGAIAWFVRGSQR
jgi:hypothetical protein